MSRVIVPFNLEPEPHGLRIAAVVSEWYRVDVTFLVPRTGYKVKTPDILMRGNEWEIKSPTKFSGSTIEQNLRKATSQSGWVILDTARLKESDEFLLAVIAREAKMRKSLRKLIVVDKRGRVVEVFKRK